jgi:hypothetical protein
MTVGLVIVEDDLMSSRSDQKNTVFSWPRNMEKIAQFFRLLVVHRTVRESLGIFGGLCAAIEI